MKYILSNKFLWLFLLLSIGTIFWFPLQTLGNPIAELNFSHFSNLLHNSLPTREYIKIFATQGLLILLLSFVILGALLIYWFNLNSKWSLKLLCSIILFLLFGMVGSFVPSNGKYQFYEISAPMQLESGDVVATVRFNKLDKKFKEYLVLAEEGKVKCSIFTHLVYNQNHTPIKVNDSISTFDQKNFSLSPQFIKDFINKPIINIELTLEDLKHLIYRDLPVYRDSPNSPPMRADTLSINGKSVNIPTECLLIYFKFESLTGDPLAAFL